MPILTICPACARKLKVRDDLAGRTIKCPKCSAAVAVPAAGKPAVPAAQWHETVPIPRPTPKPASKPAPRRAPAAAAPEKQTPAKPPERPRPKRPVRKEPEPEEVYVPDLVEEAEEVEAPRKDDRVPRVDDRPRKKKKKRRRNPDLGWYWWAGGSAAVVLVAAAVMILILRSGHRDAVVRVGIELAIMVPLSLVILIVSMLISSALGGGIDFGALHTAILKAILLLTTVNLVTLIPNYVGDILVFPIWLIGLMWLYGLDFWEARFLIFINWFLNTILKYAVVAVLLVILLGGKGGHGLDFGPDSHPEPAAATESEKAIETIDKLGGQVEHQPGDEDDPPVIGVTLVGTPVTDGQLAALKNFPRLRTLDLSGTRVTDAGLEHLKGLGQLQHVRLTGTPVTNQGVAGLQKVLPRAKIER